MLESLKLALLATANCTFAVLKTYPQREGLGGTSIPSGRGRLAHGSLSQISILAGCPRVASDP